MIIKRYLQFIKESSGPHQFGCVMLDVKTSQFMQVWNDVVKEIREEDVYEKQGDTTHGIEDDAHLTLLYGTENSVTIEDIKSVFTGEKKIDINISGIDLFENSEFDVLKFNVEITPQLQSIHDKLLKLPNQDQYPKYRPHITIVYLNKGSGKNYINPEIKMQLKGLDKICYSLPSGEKVYFNI